jgi:DNA-binding NarL/FixJ family response regulator
MQQPAIDICIMSPSTARQDWLQRAIGDEHSIQVKGTAVTFPFLRSLIDESPVDVAVIDLHSKRESSVVREWLVELVNLVAVLLLSSSPDPAIVKLILNAKAGGLLSGDASSEQIVQAIKSVASRLMIFDGALMHDVSLGAGDGSPVMEPLTPRESEVLRLLADGSANKEIADRLKISEHTIKFHIRSILGKLGASSRTDAVSRGLRSGLIEL